MEGNEIWSKRGYSGERVTRGLIANTDGETVQQQKMNNRQVYEQMGSTQLPKMYSGGDRQCRWPRIGQEIAVVNGPIIAQKRATQSEATFFKNIATQLFSRSYNNSSSGVNLTPYSGVILTPKTEFKELFSGLKMTPDIESKITPKKELSRT